jgi:ankyrin repeat protein
LLIAAAQCLVTLEAKVTCLEGTTPVTETIFQELIGRGANVMAQDNDGNTLHHLGALNGKESFYEPLKEVIAKARLLHQPNHGGETAFHYSLRGGSFRIVDFFFDIGAFN